LWWVFKLVDVTRHLAEQTDPSALGAGLRSHVRALGRLLGERGIDVRRPMKRCWIAAHRTEVAFRSTPLLVAVAATTMTVDTDPRLAQHIPTKRQPTFTLTARKPSLEVAPTT